MSLEPLEKEKRKRPFPFAVLMILLAALLAVTALLLVFYEREAPQLRVVTDISRFGLHKEIELVATDSRSGLRSLRVDLVQGKKRRQVFTKDYPRHGYLGRGGPARSKERFSVEVRSLGFRDGMAELVVTARDYSWWDWMRGNRTVRRFPVVLDTKPPMVAVLDAPRYIKAGSAGVVVYRVNEPVSGHGVMVNNLFHPGFPLARLGEGVYGALIGLPYDLEHLDQAYVTATDQAGNIGRAELAMIVRPMRFVHDRITISDSFLKRKLPEFARHLPGLSGSPIEQFLVINRKLRAENYRTVQEICRKSVPERLWDGPFKRMARSSRRAGFADHRTYYYHGRKVDQQVHLGVDLASVRHAPVEAANRGKVVFADYLGIYGNTVILDHGQGLFSLYSHMSQIAVHKGELVDKGGKLGLTGATGLAGGDHLHFSILINGVFVNPVEWWDKRWLAQTILSVL